MSDKDITLELIHELGKMSISELEGFWPIWNAELEGLGVGEYAKNFCKTTIDLVIDKKRAHHAENDFYSGRSV